MKGMKWIILALVVLMVAGFGACSKDESAEGDLKGSGEAAEPPKGEVTVTFMNNESGLPQDFIDSFNNENEGNIMLVRTEYDWTKFIADAMAGTAADLMMLGSGSDVAYYVNRGLFYPMDELIAESDAINVEDIEFKPNAEYKYDKETGNFGEGHWYGFSKDYNNIGCITYNKEMFDAAGIPYLSDEEPITYDEFYELAKKLTIKDDSGNVKTFGTEFTPGWIRFLVSDMAYMSGLSFYTDDTRSEMNNDPKMRDLWKYWARLMVEDIAPNVRNPSPSGWTGASFESDRVAMVQLGYWFGANLQKNEGFNEKYGWAPTPFLKKGGERVTNTLGATGIVMYAKTKHPKKAFEVFEWYMAGAYGIERAKTGWGIPPLKSLYKYLPQDNEYNKQRYKVAMDDAKYFKPWQTSPHIAQATWEEAWMNNIDPLVMGKIDYDTFIDNYYEDMNENLERGYEETQALMGQ
jgi:multiple sugar transport system substrate-binding protein